MWPFNLSEVYHACLRAGKESHVVKFDGRDEGGGDRMSELRFRSGGMHFGFVYLVVSFCQPWEYINREFGLLHLDHHHQDNYILFFPPSSVLPLPRVALLCFGLGFAADQRRHTRVHVHTLTTPFQYVCTCTWWDLNRLVQRLVDKPIRWLS